MAKAILRKAEHNLCVICEGDEDFAYFNRLIELNVWNPIYGFTLINAKGASNIPARFQNAYQNDLGELTLVFCDTDKPPHREYAIIKKKINALFGKRKAADYLIIFANPCTMQIILSHFGTVSLKNQGKKTNASVIESLTGVKSYDAHQNQIENICSKIFQKTYSDMRKRVASIDYSDDTSCSTNFIKFLDRFESADAKWIREIQKYLNS